MVEFCCSFGDRVVIWCSFTFFIRRTQVHTAGTHGVFLRETRCKSRRSVSRKDNNRRIDGHDFIHTYYMAICIYTYVISSQSGFKSSARSCLYKIRNGLISILIWTDLMCIYIIHYTYILFKNILIDAFITTTIITIMGSFVSLSRSPPLFVANGVPFSASLYIIYFFFPPFWTPKVVRCLCTRVCCVCSGLSKRFYVQTSRN